LFAVFMVGIFVLTLVAEELTKAASALDGPARPGRAGERRASTVVRAAQRGPARTDRFELGTRPTRSLRSSPSWSRRGLHRGRSSVAARSSRSTRWPTSSSRGRLPSPQRAPRASAADEDQRPGSAVASTR
jgi:hypothetical protein